MAEVVVPVRRGARSQNPFDDTNRGEVVGSVGYETALGAAVVGVAARPLRRAEKG